MSSATVTELVLWAHPAEYRKERGELRKTTAQVAWMAYSGPATESIPWAQLTKDEYSKFNPAKAVDVVSVRLIPHQLSRVCVLILSNVLKVKDSV
jgi:hypothetical protein